MMSIATIILLVFIYYFFLFQNNLFETKHQNAPKQNTILPATKESREIKKNNKQTNKINDEWDNPNPLEIDGFLALPSILV